MEDVLLFLLFIDDDSTEELRASNSSPLPLFISGLSLFFKNTPPL